MAPIDLQTHSCNHCQRLIIDIREQERGGNNGDMSHGRVLFNFTLRDVRYAAAEGCEFCKWFLDQEHISRESTTRHLENNLEADDPFFKVMAALQDQMLGISLFTGPPSPENSLRNIISEQGDALDSYRLIASPYQGSGNVRDIFNFEYFGLWNPVTTKIVYRTRRGFQVFANYADIASEAISTRPIEANPGSADSLLRISSWLTSCRANHPRCRHMRDAAMAEGTKPERLLHIDYSKGTYQLHLQSTQGMKSAPDFIALSYCWGGDQDVKCTISTINNFAEDIRFEELPLTIKHAIITCQQLGFQYLWVDSLCIIQDDDSDKAVEIAKMPSVYGTAVLTIAASRARSANEGFLNERVIDPTTSAFTLPYRCANSSIGFVTLVDLDVSAEPIDSRGWTMQERLLSPRTVEFGTRQTRWVCQESGYDRGYGEGWRAMAEYNSTRKDTLNLPDQYEGNPLNQQQWSNETFLQEWNQVIKSYTRRLLTVPTDRALAISGIAKKFSSVLGNVEYVAGLWREMIFPGLIWYIDRDAISARPTSFLGPSWSWTSVLGPVSHQHFSPESWRPENITAEIMSCSLDLANDRAPYGAIRQDSRRLRVRGLVAPGTCVKTEGNTILDRGKMSVGFFGANDSGPMCIGMCEMFSDTTELDDANGSAIMVLEIQRATRGASWECNGLVLRRADCEESDNPYEGTVFKRVGVFQFQSGRQGQRSEESSEDWRRRIDTEFNWFKNVIPREIEII